MVLDWKSKKLLAWWHSGEDAPLLVSSETEDSDKLLWRPLVRALILHMKTKH